LAEAAPGVVFGVICFFYLTDRPAEARWLATDEKAWLESEMQKEKRTLAQHRSFSVLQTLVNWRVLALAAIHFGQAGVSVGLAVFVAQIIKGLGLTNMQTGFTTVTAITNPVRRCVPGRESRLPAGAISGDDPR
jgi:ACS family tartrate transporter-like MFS transporter